MTSLLALTAVLASWDTASTVCLRLEDEPLKDVVSRCFLSVAFLLVVFHVLGFCQLLSGWAIVRMDVAAALSVGLAIATRLVLSSEAQRRRAKRRARRVACLSQVTSQARRDPVLVALGLCALGVHGLLVAAVLSAPPRGFDALWYHLPNALQWYRTHTVAVHVGSYTDFYPGNAELLALPLLTLGNDAWVGLVQYPWFILAALITGLLVQRTGAAPRTAWATGLTVLTVPLLVYQSMQFYVDVICAALSLGSLLYLVDWLRLRRTRDLVLCMLTASMLLGTKYVATFLSLFPVAIVVVATLRQSSHASTATRSATGTALFIVGGLGTAFSWLWWARNAAAAGNPIAPLHVGFMLHVLLGGHLLSSAFASGPTSATDVFAAFATAYGPLILLVPAGVASTLWRWRRASIARHADLVGLSLAYIAWCGFTFVLFFTYDPRFVIAAMVMGVVLVAASSAGASRAVVHMLLVVALINGACVARQIVFADDFALSLNRLSRNQFYGLPDEIDELPVAARVLLRGHPALVYPAAGVHRTNVVVPSPMGVVEEEITRWQIDYVLVRTAEPDEIERLVGLPLLQPIRISALVEHHWWDFWPERQPKLVGLFKVVR